MKPERIAQWDKTRQKGRGRFIILRGVLGWGIPTAILFELFMSIREGNWSRLDFPHLLISSIVFPIGGIFFGAFLWKANERTFTRSKQLE